MPTPLLNVFAGALLVLVAGGPLHAQEETPPDQPGRADVASPDVQRWETWWTLRRDRYLGVREAVWRQVQSGATGVVPSTIGAPDSGRVADMALPALLAATEPGTDAVLASEAVLALARADFSRRRDDAQSERAGRRLRELAGHDDLLVAESAVLALGIHGKPANAPLLAELLADSEAGRSACKRDGVPARLRSAAAYALGLVARRAQRSEVQRYAAHALAPWIAPGADASQDQAAACAVALGLLDLGASTYDDDGELPAAASSAALARALFAIADDAKQGLVVRAHAAVAGAHAAACDPRARLAGIAWCASALAADRPSVLREAGVLGLATLAQPGPDDADRAARASLYAAREDTDRLVRAWAWIGLGEVGGRARDEADRAGVLEVQEALANELASGRSGMQAFAALGMGVLGHGSSLVAAADGNRSLRAAWERSKSISDTSAIGLALGLRHDRTSVPALLERFPREGDPRAKSALALALGFAGVAEARPLLVDASGTSNHPLVVRDAAIARALLGDRDVGAQMLALLVGTKSLLYADFAADALQWVGDPSALPALAELARDTAAPSARRAQAVRALGTVADADPLPWNEPFRAAAHYGAPFGSLTNPSGTGILDRR